MTSKIVTRMEFTAAPFASIRHAVVDLAMGVWRLIVAVKHRRELAHLADLDDRMLADIGLTRTDLRDACSEPLWRDPTSMLTRSRQRAAIAARVPTKGTRIAPRPPPRTNQHCLDYCGAHSTSEMGHFRRIDAPDEFAACPLCLR